MMPHVLRRNEHHPGGQRRAIGRLDIFDLSRRVTRSLGGQQSALILDLCAMDATSEDAPLMISYLLCALYTEC